MGHWMEGLLARTTEVLDRRVRWYRLLRPLALIVLIGLRIALRRRNLYDTTARR